MTSHHHVMISIHIREPVNNFLYVDILHDVKKHYRQPLRRQSSSQLLQWDNSRAIAVLILGVTNALLAVGAV